MKGLLLDPETYDLTAPTGTLRLGDTSAQTAEFVLVATPGEWKQHPRLGADLPRQLGGVHDPFWTASARRMLRAVGLDVATVTLSDDGTVTVS